ncbi:Crp/Fnr family transcriptional regulator [Roseospirillum parvum]|uniref:CRP/FNR family transcriptional regulator, anaerobic regulatory protein n=1 Tax=Roseospirillum parvum TaxID=83401 RepID=A0A1G8EV75_9PROT|nr:Crp/Fnr family transcriptional regulator [Roseospirillum parvum]SDH73811.1 CRP/FNR family transcriptional regulator, anaerobic regulatory protein [Roseospirillum parvum]
MPAGAAVSIDRLIAGFPSLQGIDAAARHRLETAGTLVRLPAGSRLFGMGSPCQGYLMVLAGSVRVQKVGESGREIVLYRVEAGQTCVLTTACLLTGADYDAEGIAETEIEGVMLSDGTFQALLAGSAPFRACVFGAFAARLSDLLELVEDVAFGRLDVRLAQALTRGLAEAAAASSLKTTHQDLASELGTAREVISRQLKEFERRGWVALGRGRIELLDPAALRRLAAQGGA